MVASLFQDNFFPAHPCRDKIAVENSSASILHEGQNKIPQSIFSLGRRGNRNENNFMNF